LQGISETYIIQQKSPPAKMDSVQCEMRNRAELLLWFTNFASA